MYGLFAFASLGVLLAVLPGPALAGKRENRSEHSSQSNDGAKPSNEGAKESNSPNSGNKDTPSAVESSKTTGEDSARAPVADTGAANTGVANTGAANTGAANTGRQAEDKGRDGGKQRSDDNAIPSTLVELIKRLS